VIDVFGSFFLGQELNMCVEENSDPLGTTLSDIINHHFQQELHPTLTQKLLSMIPAPENAKYRSELAHLRERVEQLVNEKREAEPKKHPEDYIDVLLAAKGGSEGVQFVPHQV
jgi:hypothetical protein